MQKCILHTVYQLLKNTQIRFLVSTFSLSTHSSPKEMHIDPSTISVATFYTAETTRAISSICFLTNSVPS